MRATATSWPLMIVMMLVWITIVYRSTRRLLILIRMVISRVGILLLVLTILWSMGIYIVMSLMWDKRRIMLMMLSMRILMNSCKSVVVVIVETNCSKYHYDNDKNG